MNWNQNLTTHLFFLHAAVITCPAFRGCSREEQALDLVCYKEDAAAIAT